MKWILAWCKLRGIHKASKAVRTLISQIVPDVYPRFPLDDPRSRLEKVLMEFPEKASLWGRSASKAPFDSITMTFG
jgi:hypothetical protein